MKLIFVVCGLVFCAGCGVNHDAFVRLQNENDQLRDRLDAAEKNVSDLQGKVGMVAGQVYQLDHQVAQVNQTVKVTGAMATMSLTMAAQAAQKLGLNVPIPNTQLPKVPSTKEYMP